MSHSVGHCGPDSDRRHIHDDVGELEHRLRQALAEGQHGAALLFADHGQGRGENQAEDYDLQHRAVGDRLRDVLREYVQNGVLCAELADRGGLRASRRGQRDAHSGLGEVNGCQPEKDGNRGNNLEVDDGAQSEPAHLPYVGVAGDAHHQRRNNSGAMMVLIKRRKISASTRRLVATFGKSCPISAPSSMAMKIHAVSVRRKQP